MRNQKNPKHTEREPATVSPNGVWYSRKKNPEHTVEFGDTAAGSLYCSHLHPPH